MKENKKEFYLQNGLKLLLQEDNRLPLVCFFLRVNDTGSSNENQYLGSGISHFVEHAVFLGSSRFPKKDEFPNYLESKGASDFNAYTDYDHTAYYFSFFSKYFSQVLHAFYDFVFNPLFPAEEVENERGTILSEMDMVYSRPNDFFYQCLDYHLEKPNFYKYPIIGIKKIFNQLTDKDLKFFHAEKYQMHNMVLSITGNVAEQEAVSEINKVFSKKNHFTKQTAGKTAPPLSYLKHKQIAFNEKESIEVTHQQVVFPKLCLVFPAANFFQDEKYPCEVFSYIVGQGEGSLLNQELKEKKN